MTKDIQRERVIKDLAFAVSEGRAGLFVGAGISAISGLPTWKEMLNELIGLLPTQPGVSSSVVSDAKILLEDKNKWLILAQILRNELGQDFFNYVGERFTSMTSRPNSVHDALVDINWRSIVTTNYDRLVERAFAKKYGGDKDVPVYTYRSPSLIASSFRRNIPFILKAHGDARESPEGIILTETDYRRLIHREIGYQTILQAMFTTTSFLFIGCSLSDPDIRLLLGFLHSSFHGDTPTHYALVSADDRLDAEDRVFYSDFRIHVVPIDPSKREEEILLFLDQLKQATKS